MSLERNAEGDFPEVAKTAFVHETATLIGNVIVEDDVFIGPNAILRADELGADGTVAPIVVSRGSNVQDCVVVHALGGTQVKIGPASSVAHAAVVHGPCEIGSNCFVGFNSVVFRSTLGDNVVVMHQALVENVTIPAGLHVPSMTPVRCEEDVRRLAPTDTELFIFVRQVAQTNLLLAQGALRMRSEN